MKAVVWKGVGDIRVEDVPDPRIEQPTAAVVRITAGAICGTDLHFVRGTIPGVEPGTILGHEAVGVVEEVGTGVRNLNVGDRVVVPSTIGCGYCPYCRAGYFAECDNADPGGKTAGTAFFGGPKAAGGVDGPQAEYDADASRLAMAGAQGAEVIDFDAEDPLEAIKELTGGAGADRAIDAVGVDAVHPHHGPGRKVAAKHATTFQQEVETVAPDTKPKTGFAPGDAPSQALRWAVDGLAEAGTLSIIGVYPEQHEAFPIGKAMHKHPTIQMGNCNHRRYIPHLVELVEGGAADPQTVLTQVEPMTDVLSAYRAFSDRRPRWVKVELTPAR